MYNKKKAKPYWSPYKCVRRSDRTEMGDENEPATKGELRAAMATLATKDEFHNLNARVLAFDEKLTALALRLESMHTGVEQSGTVIPEGTKVVENNSWIEHVSRAISRHKGRQCTITIVFKNAKKYA